MRQASILWKCYRVALESPKSAFQGLRNSKPPTLQNGLLADIALSIPTQEESTSPKAISCQFNSIQRFPYTTKFIIQLGISAGQRAKTGTTPLKKLPKCRGATAK
jgi:hypothetical protein